MFIFRQTVCATILCTSEFQMELFPTDLPKAQLKVLRQPVELFHIQAVVLLHFLELNRETFYILIFCKNGLNYNSWK